MAIFKSAQKILVAANYPAVGAARRTRGGKPAIRPGDLYLHLVLTFDTTASATPGAADAALHLLNF
jgi:hypothetical protein